MYQEQAEKLYRETSPYPGSALDRHCIRLADITLALGRHHEVALEEDLVRGVAWVHDIGLMVREDGVRDYPKRGLNFVRPLFDGWGLAPEKRRVVDEMMLYNHGLLPVTGLSREAEMLRCAVQVEHSMGAVAHGLSRGEIRGIFLKTPRKGLTRILVDFARITLVEDGPPAILPIFFPRGPGV